MAQPSAAYSPGSEPGTVRWELTWDMDPEEMRREIERLSEAQRSELRQRAVDAERTVFPEMTVSAAGLREHAEEARQATDMDWAEGTVRAEEALGALQEYARQHPGMSLQEFMRAELDIRRAHAESRRAMAESVSAFRREYIGEWTGYGDQRSVIERRPMDGMSAGFDLEAPPLTESQEQELREALASDRVLTEDDAGYMRRRAQQFRARPDHYAGTRMDRMHDRRVVSQAMREFLLGSDDGTSAPPVLEPAGIWSPCWSCGAPSRALASGFSMWNCDECEVLWDDSPYSATMADRDVWCQMREVGLTHRAELVDFGKPGAPGSPA